MQGVGATFISFAEPPEARSQSHLRLRDIVSGDRARNLWPLRRRPGTQKCSIRAVVDYYQVDASGVDGVKWSKWSRSWKRDLMPVEAWHRASLSTQRPHSFPFSDCQHCTHPSLDKTRPVFLSPPIPARCCLPHFFLWQHEATKSTRILVESLIYSRNHITTSSIVLGLTDTVHEPVWLCLTTMDRWIGPWLP